MGAALRGLRHDVLYLSLRGLFAVGRGFPLRLLQGLGSALGSIACLLARRDRDRALLHLERAFPDLSPDEHRRLVRRCARHLGQNLGEVVWMATATPEQIAGVCSITGVHHLLDALSPGRGAVLITGHCGNWEMLNARLGVAGIPLTIAVRAVDDPRIDRMATTLRSRHGAEIVPRSATAGRRLVRALLGNRVIGLLIDQDIRDVPGVFVPFFGYPSWTPAGAATLALRIGCPVVPAFVHRLPGGRHLAEVYPPLAVPGGAGADEDRVVAVTSAATQAIERQIRSYPDQWVWMHRRWKTRPPDDS